jgi:dipeptidyl aminopeptidase/acylaminoacyl peptidase
VTPFPEGGTEGPGTGLPGVEVAEEAGYPPPGTPQGYPPPEYVPVTATPDPNHPPECQFPGGASPEVSGPALEDYVFSEPQVVLTHTEGIRIASWLPDNQRLLITRVIPGQPNETIETFNVQTSELTLFGTRHALDGYNPIWLEDEQAVLFQAWQADGTVTLQKIQTSNENPETLAIDLDYSEISVSPNEQNIVFFTNSQKTSPNFSNLDVSQISTSPIQLPATYGRETGRHVHSYFQSTWAPDGSRIAFYRNHGLFLANPSNGEVCEVSFNDPMTWAYFARWSSDGRFLAMITTTSLSTPLQSTELTVLDTVTGEIRILQVVPDAKPGQHYVRDINWLPNSYDLLLLGRVRYEEGHGFDNLYLVDVGNGEYLNLFPTKEFHGIPGTTLVISPNGEQAAVWCSPEPDLNTFPLMGEISVCLFSIGEQP